VHISIVLALNASIHPQKNARDNLAALHILLGDQSELLIPATIKQMNAAATAFKGQAEEEEEEEEAAAKVAKPKAERKAKAKKPAAAENDEDEEDDFNPAQKKKAEKREKAAKKDSDPSFFEVFVDLLGALPEALQPAADAVVLSLAMLPRETGKTMLEIARRWVHNGKCPTLYDALVAVWNAQKPPGSPAAPPAPAAEQEEEEAEAEAVAA